MTNQEVFDKVILHLRTQKQACLNEENLCCFRNSLGLQCAAGVLIEESEYSSWMEKYISFSSLLKSDKCPISLKERYESNLYLISELQKIHDLFTPDKWETKFLEISKIFNLKLI